MRNSMSPEEDAAKAIKIRGFAIAAAKHRVIISRCSIDEVAKFSVTDTKTSVYCLVGP